MMFTRWKLMTGVLGFSIGGWATLGNTGDKKVDVPPPPVVAPLPAPVEVAAAGPAPVLPSLPAIPAMPPAAVLPPSSPVVELPGLPMPESKPVTKLPPKPVDLPVVPASAVSLPEPPSVAPSLPPMPKTAVDVAVLPKPTPTAPELPVVEYTKPAAPPATFTAPAATPANVSPPASFAAPAAPASQPTVPVSTVTSKFRIVLRVGAGEPTFEVRHDDDLVMKVVCEKVDIKSPEKGHGPSNVTATGKVRFVGFGAEGTCDSFSFLAGTGEVSLTGHVNVKVRDKIGRVESELQAEKMQYKLDQTALTGTLKP
jgi:hypothetical protein